MPWDPNVIDSEILAIHAAFLNYGQILFFGGDQHDPEFSNDGNINAIATFDCGSMTVKRVDFDEFDLFCSGHSLTVQGVLLAAGGTHSFPSGVDPDLHHDHFPGLRDSAAFRITQNGLEYSVVARMNPGEMEAGTPFEGETGGRWYPTLLTLANGDILAMSGHPGRGDREHSNYVPEVFVPNPSPRGRWHRLGRFPPSEGQSNSFKEHDITYYPRLHLLPTGDILMASPARGRTCTLEIGKAPWSARFHDVCEFTPGRSGQYLGWSEGSVLLPLSHEDDFRPRVLLCGGEQAWVLDLGEWNPGQTPARPIEWVPTQPRSLANSPRRIHGMSVILPTGEILVVGGVAGAPPTGAALDATAVQTPEIYNPRSRKWKALTSEKAKVVRNYHSVALLMPDGRVWTAGGDRDASPGIAAANLQIEIYEPWYVNKPNRPTILSVPDRWKSGETIDVHTDQASNTARVVMVRCGSFTHAFNADQRLVSLRFRHGGGERLEVDIPGNGNVLPSGFYFVFTVNNDGLPSLGSTVYLTNDPLSEVERAWEGLFAK